MKHTPGPWKIGSPIGIKNPQGQWVNEPVYSVFYNDEGPDRGPSSMACAKLADAHLIAAAPELLNVCKLLVNYYDRKRNEIKLSKGYPDPSAFIENLDAYIPHIREAINKAEGEVK